MSRRDQAGFTLLETLVTLVVLGFLMTGLVQGLRLGIASWQAQARALAARGDLDATERTLRTLISRLDTGHFTGRPPIFKGTADSLMFTTTLQQAAVNVPTQEAEVKLAVDDSRRLQLLWLPHYRNRIGPLPDPERVMLLDNVDHVEMAYWQEPQAGWKSEWSGRETPKLVRIRIVFTRPSGRFAPDIVVRLMRDRWRQ